MNSEYDTKNWYEQWKKDLTLRHWVVYNIIPMPWGSFDEEHVTKIVRLGTQLKLQIDKLKEL